MMTWQTRLSDALEAFDLAMDPLLDEEQTQEMVATISMALALRLVQYNLGRSGVDCVAITQQLVTELATLKRNIAGEGMPN